jgi:hypothetical protein
VVDGRYPSDLITGGPRGGGVPESGSGESDEGGGMLTCLILRSICSLGLKFHSTGIFAVGVGTNFRLESMFW